MASEKKDQVVLVTSDEETYTVERKVAERSNLIKSMIEGASFEPWAHSNVRALSVAT